MARPKNQHPTGAELEVLKMLWSRGPLTVREVLEQLPEERAYTSVMSLLNVMFEKGLVTREPEGRAFRYTSCHEPGHHQSSMIGDLLDRVFAGSASALVARLLEHSEPTESELDEIRKVISQHKRQRSRKDA